MPSQTKLAKLAIKRLRSERSFSLRKISGPSPALFCAIKTENRGSLLQNCLDLAERRFLGYWCARTHDTTLSNRQQQISLRATLPLHRSGRHKGIESTTSNSCTRAARIDIPRL
jgi:hypothetical protein